MTSSAEASGNDAGDLDLRMVREVAERQAVLVALSRTDRNIVKAAELLGVSRLTVSQLLHEHRALSPDMAMRLEKMLGTTAESWLRMQQAVELWEARQRPERFASIKRLPASAAA